MRKNALKWMCLLSVALAFALSLPSRAAADDSDDPPSRVARLAFTRGAVSFSARGHRRLGGCHRQSSDDHRR